MGLYNGSPTGIDTPSGNPTLDQVLAAIVAGGNPTPALRSTPDGGPGPSAGFMGPPTLAEQHPLVTAMLGSNPQPSPMVEDAPAPRFSGAQHPGGGLMDRLAIALGHVPDWQETRGGNANNIVGGLLTGLAQGFARTQGASMDDRASTEDAMKKRQADLNARAQDQNDRQVAIATARGKENRDREFEQQKLDAEKASYLPVPGWVSRALYGNDSLTGARRKDTVDLTQQAREKLRDAALGTRATATIEDKLPAKTKYMLANLDDRRKSMSAAIERWQMALTDPLKSASPKSAKAIQDRIDSIQNDLDAANKERDAILIKAGLMDAPAPPPTTMDSVVTPIAPANTRTQALPGGYTVTAPLPPGEKPIDPNARLNIGAGPSVPGFTAAPAQSTAGAGAVVPVATTTSSPVPLDEFSGKVLGAARAAGVSTPEAFDAWLKQPAQNVPGKTNAQVAGTKIKDFSAIRRALGGPAR